jgi:hypothetical protein
VRWSRRDILARFALCITAKFPIRALLVPLFGQFRKLRSRKLGVSLLDIGCLRWRDINEECSEIIGP